MFSKKVKRYMLAGFALLGVMAFVAGCGSNTSGGGNDVPKKIVVGLDDNYPPMGFHDEKGNIVGFDIDMAKEAAKRSGLEVEFKPIDWDSKEAELKSKHIDVLWNGLTMTPEREKNMDFSIPYLKDQQILVVKNDSPIKDMKELAGKTVGTQAGSTTETAMMNDPFTKQMKGVKKYGDFVSAFMDLETGRIDAVATDGITGHYLMNKKPGTFRVINGAYGAEIDAVGFRKGDKALEDKINAALASMIKDGTADKLAMKWFGTKDMIYREAAEKYGK